MLTALSEHKAFGGTLGYYQHAAWSTSCEMKFAVYQPAGVKQRSVPVLVYLAGLTCTEETFVIKSGALKYAAEYDLMLVAPDTSPRGEQVPDDEAWDIAQGAGFYINATKSPWSTHYRMYDYVTRELPELIERHFPSDMSRQGIFGHSMGGHGALTIGLKNPRQYRSISAFAPICAPTHSPWGIKAFSHYLGDDKATWENHDASILIRQIVNAGDRPEILIDQGMADGFLEEQLHPHLLVQAAESVGYPVNLRRHAGYDHGYFFISTFIKDHIRHHADSLN